MELQGCGTALVTPFHADGSLDEAALRSLVNWQIESGINFLIPCGTTGEASTLDEEEWLRVVEVTVQTAAGRVPVFGGCTTPLGAGVARTGTGKRILGNRGIPRDRTRRHTIMSIPGASNSSETDD